jgi:lipopolysaccharide biosynthesis regulator YciM
MAMRSRDWTSDLTIFESTIAHNPKSPRAHDWVGSLLDERGDHLGAVAHFERVRPGLLEVVRETEVEIRTQVAAANLAALIK